MMNITNKNIVITGGTSGIGYELVKKLSSKNHVIVISRNTNKLQKIEKKFNNVSTYSVDLSILKELEQAADKIVKHYKKVDILINNAAVQYTPTFLDDNFTYETIHREISVNFISVCSLTYLMLPAMLDDKENSIILNVNSGLGLMPKTTSAVYCATKGAINIFSQALRNQLEHTNIKVLQGIMPLVNTPMTHGRGKGKLTSQLAAYKLIYGLEKEILDHDIGKVKFLRLLMRFAPSVAKNIMKKY